MATHHQVSSELTFDQKINIIKSAATLAGFYPDFEVSEDQTKIFFEIYNCPFKEIAMDHTETVCNMHFQFLRGMFESIFESVELVEKQNMITGCNSCAYQAVLA